MAYTIFFAITLEPESLNGKIIIMYSLFFSMPAISQGQFLISNDSEHFGFLFTARDTKKYLTGKLLFLHFWTIVSFIIFSTIALYKGSSLWIPFYLLMINVFIVNPFTLLISLFSVKKKILTEVHS